MSNSINNNNFATTIATNISTLSSHFQSNYGPGTSSYSHMDSDSRDIVDACINCLQNNIHPANVISEHALLHLKNYISFDFKKYTCVDSLEGFLPTNVDVKNEPVKISLKDSIPSNACCKFYSFENNTSQEYAYANIVEFPTCSNEKLNNHSCTTPLFQTRCSFYVADHSIFTTHTLVKDEKEYSYVSYITRTQNGNINISIYDNEENLLNELVYSYIEIKEIGLDKIKDEIISIVSVLHESAFIENNPLFNFTDHANLPKELDLSNSYIASLIN